MAKKQHNIIFFSAFCLFFLFSSSIFAQTDTKEALARQYYLNQEYSKASVYYKQLYEKSESNDYYYSYLLNCYIQLNQYKDAENLAKRQQRKFSGKPQYYVDIGHIYQLEGKQSKAEKEFKDAINNLPPNANSLENLADAFEKIEAYDYALKVYDNAQRLLGYDNFNMQRAHIYSLEGNYASMINQYLNLLKISPAYLQSVQNALQFSLQSSIGQNNKQVLKQELLKRVQKHPNKTVYARLLIWYYIQDKNFQGAFIQARAIDRREDRQGVGVFKLASIAKENKDFATALKCYDYIIKSYEKGSYYVVASKMNKVETLFDKIENSAKPSKEDLQNLKTDFSKTIAELGNNSPIAPLLQQQAKFYTEYLHKPDSAIAILKNAIDLPGIEKHERANCKIQLADVLVYEGKVWKAALLYGQVETALPNSSLEDQAKFKNAKISYYTGNFKWAKAQLDVLKASTSKLIANNAMDLSILISENLAADTNTTPLKMYAEASLLVYQRKYDEALQKFSAIDSLYPVNSLTDDILIEKGKIYRQQQQFQKAVGYYEKVVKVFPKSIWADNALFILGQIYQNDLKDKQKAMDAYKQIMTNYKSSIYVQPARRNFRILRGDKIYEQQNQQLENQNL